MSLQWADFPSGQPGLYGTDSNYMLNGTPWISFPQGIVEDPDPLVTGNVMRANSKLAIPEPDTTMGIAFRFWLTEILDSVRPIILYNKTDGSTMYTLGMRPNGGLEVKKGGSSTSDNIVQADFPLLFANSWNHIEMIINTASGAIEVRVNGITRLNGTDSVPANANVGIITFASQYPGQGSNTTQRWKDIVVYNSQGTEFNDWQGSVSVFDMLPAADVTVGGWVPSTGTTAWNLLDESPPDDNDYISADDTLPAAAEITFTPLPPDTTSVRAIMAIVRSLKTDGGDGSLQVSMSPDGTNYDNGNNNPITTAATYRWDISELSPATSDPWTPIEANDVRMKFNRTV